MTPVPAPSPAPRAAAAPTRHGSQISLWVPGGRVRNRRDRQHATRCLTGPDQARGARTGRSRRVTAESP
jgi:hypothetical protein